MRKILVATDFSPPAERAAEVAIELARATGASLVLLHVIHLDTYVFFDGSTYVPSPHTVARVLADANQRLGALEKQARAALPGVEGHVVEGSPYDDVVRFADENHCDLIVVGTHGRRGLSHLLLGSVAERVVRTAKQPVLTVRAPA